jgi:hypothetical protein
LEDVALLLHFDGGHPYETNYTGEPNAVPMGQVPTVNNNIHYRPGKFYKAAVFGRSGTNLITNPSFETNLTGWTVVDSGGGDIAATRVTNEAWYGLACARLTWTTIGSAQFFTVPVASATAGDYAFSVWLRSNIPMNVELRFEAVGVGTTGSSTVSVTEDWQRFSVIGTFAAGQGVRCAIRPSASATATVLWVDGAQLEQGSTSSFYMDGSLGAGYAWTGTAHASTSTRGNSLLRYTLSNMVAHRWTMMGYFCFPDTPKTSGGYFWMTFADGSRVSIRGQSNGVWSSVELGGVTSGQSILSSVVANRWYHIAVTYNGATLRWYVDGVLVQSATLSAGGNIPTTLSLGISHATTYENVMMDDVVVSRQCLSAERLLAIVQSDAPVFAESSVFHFRATPKGLVWADEEGLWMRDTDGDTVLGAYGGEASTKSWGGFTLAQGDIAFGRYGASDGGWFRFDRDGVSSKPYLSLGYSDKTVIAFDTSGASLAGVLDIDAAGGIYQGSGSFASPTTGLKIWNSSGVGRIGGYNAGTAQWYADTDGKLYAGGGNVLVDANGINVSQSGGTGAYARMYPGSGVTIGSRATDVVDLASTGSGSFSAFSGLTIQHLIEQAFAGFSLAESGTTHQAILGLSNYASPNATELGIVAETFNSTDANNNASVILKAEAWGMAPYARSVRMELSANDGWIRTIGDIVALGDISGTGLLSVDGAGSVGGGLTISGGTIEFDPGSGSNATRAFNFNIGGGNYGKILIPSGSGGAMAFYTGTINAAAERMRITPDGDMGIGATVPTARLYVYQSSATRAIPVLTLDQVDLSEEFIQFNTTVGAGNPVDTAAVGTYYGKVRVSVNGTFKYIPLYNT